MKYLIYLVAIVTIVYQTHDLILGQIVSNEAISELDNILIQEQQRLNYDKKQRPNHMKEKTPTANLFDAPQFPAPTEGAVPSFSIQTITLEGSTQLSRSTLYRLKQPYLNKQLTINDINQLIKDLTNTYIKKGFVTTRVYIPKQNLKDGSLTLSIVEGRIETIEITDGTDWMIKTAFPFLEGAILNMNDIEQGLDTLNKLGSNHARAQLIPSQEFGYTIVKISNQMSQKGSASLRYDNFSGDDITLLPNSLTVGYDQVLGINDHWYLNYSQQFKDRNEFNNSLSVSASLPLGHVSWETTYSQFDYLTLVDGSNTTFLSSGGTTTLSSELEAILSRDYQSTNTLSGFVGLSAKDTTSFIEDAVSDSGTRKLVMLHTGSRLSLGNWQVDLTYTAGIPKLKATIDDDSTDDYDPKAQFQRGVIDISWYKNHTMPKRTVQFSSTFKGQISNQNLYSSEQLSIGSFYTVQGYTTAYQGDKGFYGSTHMSYPITPTLSLKTSLNGGAVWQKGGRVVFGDEGKAVLTSTSIGLTWYVSDLTLNWVYSEPLWASGYIEKENYVTYFSVSKSLF
jgi:hemolysin activation/secretion protein